MNSYDARAGLKLGFTAAGTAIGGPIGGTIGSAVGTLAGALIPTKTFIRQKTSFDENVDQNMSYSRADYGKGFLNYTSQEREKATSFSKIADTAADAIPMVAGATGFNGLSKFKFPSLGGKTDALTEAGKVISTGNEVTAEIGTAVKNNTMKKVFDYGTKSIGTINDMVDLFGNKNATEVDNNSENKLGLSNKLFMRDNNFKSTPIETDFNSIDFDKSMNKVMGLKGESVFRSIDSYKEFPTSEFGVEQRIDPITNNLQRKEFSFQEPKLIKSNTPALDVSNMPERNNRQSEIKNSEESNYLAKKFSGESSTNQSFFRSLDPMIHIEGKSANEIDGFNSLERKPSIIPDNNFTPDFNKFKPRTFIKETFKMPSYITRDNVSGKNIPKDNNYRNWWYEHVSGNPKNGGIGYQGNEEYAKSVFDAKYNNKYYKNGISPTLETVTEPNGKFYESYNKIFKGTPINNNVDIPINTMDYYKDSSYFKNGSELKYEQNYFQTPSVRTEADSSFIKGHPLVNEKKNIVLHHTGTYQSSKNTFLTKGQNSAHVEIGLDGKRNIFASPDQVTFHAGKSSYNGRDNVNDYSIGVEFTGNTSKTPLTEKQLESFAEYAIPLMKRYGIKIEDILSHQDITKNKNGTSRKSDVVSSEKQKIINYIGSKMKKMY